MNTAVIYVRVSTQEQAKGFSLESQMDALQEYAITKGIKVLETFSERGETGKTFDRPAFQAMLEYCQKNQVDYVLVHRIDRLGRNIEKFLFFKRTFGKLGTQLISIQENFEDTPQGRFMENLMACQAQYYSDELSYKVGKGMIKAMENGYTPYHAPVGYINSGRGRVVVDEVKALLLRELFQAYADGASLLGLVEYAAKIKFTNKGGQPLILSTIHYMLRNRYYIGEIWHKGKLTCSQGNHTAIIPIPLFTEVQEKMTKNKPKITGKKTEHLLTGILKCSRCGRSLVAEVQSGNTNPPKEYVYYRCHKCKGLKAIREDNFIKDIIIPDMQKLHFSEEDWKITKEAISLGKNKIITTKQALRNKLDQRRSKLEKDLDTYMEMRKDGELTKEEYLAKKNTIQAELNGISSERELEDGSVIRLYERVEQFFELCRNAVVTFSNAEPQDKKLILKTIYLELLVDNGELASICQNEAFAQVKNDKHSNMVGVHGFEPWTSTL